jgi:hypothetical protein
LNQCAFDNLDIAHVHEHRADIEVLQVHQRLRVTP